MMRLSNVDFPAFGRPTSEAYPALGMRSSLRFRLRLRRQPHAHLVNAAALRFEHFDLQTVAFERLAHGGDATGASQHVTAHSFEALGFDLDPEPIAHLGNVDLGAEDKRSIT